MHSIDIHNKTGLFTTYKHENIKQLLNMTKTQVGSFINFGVVYDPWERRRQETRRPFTNRDMQKGNKKHHLF